ncbi:hypothetical protein SK128_005218 [Halocaridina rubra]|uniref:Uncharacterized protein n=1 Tax=Halocaridina rubra TaxID=373956 RepID=A0AAN8XKN1_HALRR
MLHFKEKKGPVGKEKSYVFSETSKNFVPIVDEKTGGSFATAQERVKGWIVDAFLPQGYPDSVSVDYLHYQFWDSSQAFCSNLAGALSLQATLIGLGVGESSATPLAATLTWLLKDGSGMVSSIAFAYWRGTQLDCNSKQWRLFADVANDVNHFLKLVAPALPVPFILTMCVSAIMLSLVGVAGGATRAAFTCHQARRDNMADVSAKDGSQETLVNLAALITSITVLPFIISSFWVTWITFILCVFLHLFTNYMAVRAVKMESLNRPRLLHILHSWFSSGAVQDISQANLAEPLFTGPAFIRDYFPFGFRLSLGSSLTEAMQIYKKESDVRDIYTKALETLMEDNYLLVSDVRQRHFFVIYRREITPHQELEAFFTAYLTVLNYAHFKENMMIALEHVARGISAHTSTSDMVASVRILAKKAFPVFLQNIQEKGWNTNKLLLAADEWRIQ